MLVRLHVIRGKANKDSVAITLPAVIGRSREADLTIIHPMISRRHCELFEDGGLVKIRDLGSLNGTYVAGEQIQEAFLPPGAIFSLGPLAFRIDYETSPKAVCHEPSVASTEAAPPTPSDIVVHSDQDEGEQVASILESHPSVGSEPATEPQPTFEPTPSVPGNENPAGIPPAIVPPDGALPNVEAWHEKEPSSPPLIQPESEAREKPREEEFPGKGSAEGSATATSSPGHFWSDQPPPFTNVISRSESEPLTPIVLETEGEEPFEGQSVSPSQQQIPGENPARLTRSAKRGKPRLSWWPFKR